MHTGDQWKLSWKQVNLCWHSNSIESVVELWQTSRDYMDIVLYTKLFIEARLKGFKGFNVFLMLE